jgi:hypothetical protein
MEIVNITRQIKAGSDDEGVVLIEVLIDGSNSLTRPSTRLIHRMRPSDAREIGAQLLRAAYDRETGWMGLTDDLAAEPG